MKNTKNLIKLSAIELFNKYGLTNTTLRMIALDIKISQGNLNYHYKTKSELIKDLYFDLIEKLNIALGSIVKNGNNLELIHTSSRKTMDIFYSYRFILRDLYQIFREEDAIKNHYVNLQNMRVNQFKLLFSELVKNGDMRNEEFEGEFGRFYQRLNILGDNWINAAELFHGSKRDKIEYYNSLLFETIYPYLTKKGKAKLLQISRAQKN